LEKAINLEVERQQDILEEGGTVAQETRLYDSVKHETRSMRSKEEANDFIADPPLDI
jgi:aspartyl-tRNA(Asn)/glutamyl-tRNA(Gln) amidotransferase subunit B